MKNIIVIIVVLLLAGLGAWYFFAAESPAETQEDEVDLSQFGQPDPNLGEGDGGVTVTEPADEPASQDTTNDEVEGDAAVNDTDESAEADAEPDEHVFDITGTSYEFSTEELRVTQGDTVTINFRSAEGFHDWVIDEFDASTSRVNAGGQSSVTFVADEAGRFEYYCSVGSHRQLGMVGTLIVEEA